MAKTLIIKGADFSANKVATILFPGTHTESISVLPTTKTLTAISGTQQLTATLTPSDSTDPVQWTSSNDSVATVSAAGLVTATGCGSCTITATSNGHTATCSVTVEPVLSDYSRAVRTFIGPNSSSGHASNCDSYVGTTQTGYDIYMLMAGTDSTMERLNVNYNFAKLDSETNKYYIPNPITGSSALRVMNAIGYVVPILLPTGTSKLVCTALNEHYGAYPMFFKSTTRAGDTDASQYYFSAYKEAGATPANYSWVYAASKEFTVPSGYDSVAVLWKADTANGATDFANLTEEQVAAFALSCK